MGKGKWPPNKSNFLIIEQRRWNRVPLGALCLALLQIVAALVTFPAILKHYWGYFLSLGHPFYIDVILMTAVHIFSLAVSNLHIYFIYKVKHPFFEQYRCEPNRPFPWERDPEKWKALLRRNVLFLVFNVLVVGPFMSTIAEPDKDNMPHRFDLASWPSLWQLVWQIIFFMFCQDFMFYCTHRVLHTRWCYKYVHKQHHEYTEAVSIGSELAHPIEFVFGNAIPFLIGPMLLQSRCHKVTILVWAIYLVYETVDSHSGYEFPWSPYRLIPFSGNLCLTLAPASYHNYHHSHSKGNYSALFSLWDTVFSTNESYYAYHEKQKNKWLKQE